MLNYSILWLTIFWFSIEVQTGQACFGGGAVSLTFTLKNLFLKEWDFFAQKIGFTIEIGLNEEARRR